MDKAGSCLLRRHKSQTPTSWEWPHFGMLLRTSCFGHWPVKFILFSLIPQHVSCYGGLSESYGCKHRWMQALSLLVLSWCLYSKAQVLFPRWGSCLGRKSRNPWEGALAQLVSHLHGWLGLGGFHRVSCNCRDSGLSSYKTATVVSVHSHVGL